MFGVLLQRAESRWGSRRGTRLWHRGMQTPGGNPCDMQTPGGNPPHCFAVGVNSMFLHAASLMRRGMILYGQSAMLRGLVRCRGSPQWCRPRGQGRGANPPSHASPRPPPPPPAAARPLRPPSPPAVACPRRHGVRYARAHVAHLLPLGGI